MDVLVAAIAAGDADAFATWMSGAERPLRQSLRRFAAQVDTEAVLQETLLRVWQVAPRFEDDGRPEGLLRLAQVIARNLAISHIRAQGRAVLVADPDRARDPEDIDHTERAAPPDPGLRRTIEACREALPDRPALALRERLAAAGRVADATLAAGLGMTKNTFLQNITRARALLAECLERAGVVLDEVWR
jgi:DNA-directed RNA polymerase specialized sigma24 family protein